MHRDDLGKREPEAVDWRGRINTNQHRAFKKVCLYCRSLRRAGGSVMRAGQKGEQQPRKHEF